MRIFICTVFCFLCLSAIPNTFASPKVEPVKPQKILIESTGSIETSSGETDDKKRAIEDVNTLIIDSYRTRLDKTLSELYENIRVATKGNPDAQIKILDKVRSDLDDKLDALADADITENRKKILFGVYFYLKSNIEAQIHVLKDDQGIKNT